MEIATPVLTDLFIMLLVAKVVGELFERLKQPPVIGELLAGIAIGPYALGWVGLPSEAFAGVFHDQAGDVLSSIYTVIAELAALILLFVVGLETRLLDILRVGVRAGLVAVLGVIIPFGLGTALMLGLSYPFVEALFMGTAMVATSVGITARVLADLGRLQEREARIILGAAVIDDILGMIVLAIVGGLGRGGQITPLEIGLVAGEAIGFTVLVTLAGRHAVQRWSIHLERLRIRNAPFVVSVLLMLGLAIMAAKIGLAAIIGAFLAGMVFAELGDEYELGTKALPLYEFFVPLFFVITGTHVDWRIFLDGSLLGFALSITGLAILGKLVGCGAGAWGMGIRSVAIVGVGMAPRGEVGLIVANVGKSLGVVTDPEFSTVVIMSVLTTLIVPPILIALYRSRGKHEIKRQPLGHALAEGRVPGL
jgi:Na+:H+ antiporter